MKKITNLIIVDASGSMTSKSEEIKGGLRDLFKDIKKDVKKQKEISFKTIVIQFSGPRNIKVLVNSKKVKELTDDIANSYLTNGMTALFDAIGLGFSLIGKKQDGVFVNILTDGDENSSQEYNIEDIKKLFSEANDKKWALTFMGTTQSAIETARTLGVSDSNTVLYADTTIGTIAANKKRSKSRALYTTRLAASTNLDDLDNTNLMTESKDEGESN